VDLFRLIAVGVSFGMSFEEEIGLELIADIEMLFGIILHFDQVFSEIFLLLLEGDFGMEFRGYFIKGVFEVVDLQVLVGLFQALGLVQIRRRSESMKRALFFELLKGVIGDPLEFRLAKGLDFHAGLNNKDDKIITPACNPTI
jgi:hypothetical protein